MNTLIAAPVYLTWVVSRMTDCEHRMLRLAALVEQLAREGRDTRRASHGLRHWQQDLDDWHQYRAKVLETVSRQPSEA